MANAAKRHVEKTDELPPGLLKSADLRRRLHALLDIPLAVSDLANALGVKEQSVRNWIHGGTAPRTPVPRIIDDLRQTVLILHEGGIRGEDAALWLHSRDRDKLSNRRPLDIIKDDPEAVLAAAELEIIEQAIAQDDASRLRLVEDPPDD